MNFSITIAPIANIPLLSFLVIIIVQRLLELRLAKKNREVALSRGAKEYGSRHYPLFIVLHTSWIISWVIEGWRMCEALPFWETPQQAILSLVSLVIFLIAQGLRYWAISSLGEAWNTRILVVPGGKRVTTGPYKFFKHPNYLAVVLELAAVPLIFGAWKTALIASLANACLLLFIRIPAENRAVEEVLHADTLNNT
jgi:methyltransferase